MIAFGELSAAVKTADGVREVIDGVQIIANAEQPVCELGYAKEIDQCPQTAIFQCYTDAAGNAVLKGRVQDFHSPRMGVVPCCEGCGDDSV